MRQGNLLPAKPEYYDRRGTIIAKISWQQNLGAHGVTTRWSYFVPTNKKAFGGAMNVGVWVRAPAGAGGVECFARINWGLPFANNDIIRAQTFNTGVYTAEHAEVGASFVAPAGASFYGEDYQGAAGPLTDFLVSAIFSEFDAQ
jgi:hypothetical protein